MPTTVTLGTTVSEKKVPTAVVLADSQFGVIGSVVRADGRLSTDPDNNTLTYTFSFLSVPIGSKVVQEGFRIIEEDGAVVSFSPDVIGDYTIGLVVSNGVQDSAQASAVSSIRAVLVPHGRSLVPDGKFIWSYLRDVWSDVENKEWFETLWSTLIQLVGSDLLKLYQNDFNKSIRDIQEQYQRRWLMYEPKLSLVESDLSFFLGNHCAGTSASTVSALIESDSFFVPYETTNDISVMARGRVVVLAGRAYTILRTTVDQAAIVPKTTVATDSVIPTGYVGLTWRAPHTLISSTQNFEELGVSAGDLLLVDVVDQASFISAQVVAQVVGVTGDRLGFVLTDEPLSAGVLPEIPNKTYQGLSEAFSILDVSEEDDGTLTFTSKALTMFDTVSSLSFSRDFFNKELTTSSVLAVGDRSFTLHPKTIIRNRSIPVDIELRSVPLLQEYIKQPDTIERDDKVYQIKNGIEYELPRVPVLMVENSDYVINGEEALQAEISFDSGSTVVDCDDGDFVDRGVVSGDTFVIESPITLAGDYEIQTVVSSTRLILTRPIPLYVLGNPVAAKVRIERSRLGQFLRFVPGLFTAKKPAPDRLWAEVSFFDNDEAIENNFGILVGLTREQVENLTTGVSYRQAVSGLMYAMTRGSAIDKVRLGIQILLGLPFSEHRGVIRSIENDYRLDVLGNAILGRVLIEDTDASGTPLGTMRVYTFPVDPVSELAGIDVNPNTGNLYQVGDTVEAFLPLAKGVEVQDYLTNPITSTASGIQQLQQFHSIRVKVNDSIFSPSEISLVSSFLKKITPSYVAFALFSTSEYADTVEVDDGVAMKIKTDYAFTDNASFSIPPALHLNAATMEGARPIFLDDGPYWVRRVGKDLVATNGSGVLTSASGGFLNPRVNETFEAPRVRAGDRLVIYSGQFQGSYTVSVVTDTTVTLSDGPALGFSAFTGVKFAIMRKVVALIKSGTGSSGSIATRLIDVDSALRTDGVAPGDVIVVGATRHLISRVGPADAFTDPWGIIAGRAAVASGFVEVASNLQATHSGVDYKIFRMKFFEAPSGTSYSVTSDGTEFLTPALTELAALLDVGDELQVQVDDLRRVTVLAPYADAGDIYITPPLSVGAHTVKICKKGKPAGAIGFDHVEKFDEEDVVDLTTINPSGTGCQQFAVAAPSSILLNSPGATPVTTLILLPGDFIVFTSGANASSDVGYGPGVYPITKIVDATHVEVPFATAAATGSYKIRRRR